MSTAWGRVDAALVGRLGACPAVVSASSLGAEGIMGSIASSSSSSALVDPNSAPCVTDLSAVRELALASDADNASIVRSAPEANEAAATTATWARA